MLHDGRHVEGEPHKAPDLTTEDQCCNVYRPIITLALYLNWIMIIILTVGIYYQQTNGTFYLQFISFLKTYFTVMISYYTLGA